MPPMARLAAALVLALAVAGSGSAVAAGPFTIQADHKVGGLAVGSGTRAQAIARFGAPSSQHHGGQSCDVTWKPLGLRISFLDFASDPCTVGGAVVLTMTSRAHWRTGLGLRVGDSVARVKALYPKAKLHPSEGWWLVPRKSCVETGGQSYPGLLARAHAGHVTALVVTAGVCE
jgi:hypothetical protein